MMGWPDGFYFLNCVLQCHLVVVTRMFFTNAPAGSKKLCEVPRFYKFLLQPQLISLSRSHSDIEDEASAAVMISWNKNQPFLGTLWHTVAYFCSKISPGWHAMKRKGSRAKSLTAYSFGDSCSAVCGCKTVVPFLKKKCETSI